MAMAAERRASTARLLVLPGLRPDMGLEWEEEGAGEAAAGDAAALPPAVEAFPWTTAGDRPLALLLDRAARGLDAMAFRPAPRGVTAGLVISDVLAAVALRLDHLGEGAVGAAGTESAASALLAAEEEGETPSDAAARGETAFRYRSRAVAMLQPRDAPGVECAVSCAGGR